MDTIFLLNNRNIHAKKEIRLYNNNVKRITVKNDIVFHSKVKIYVYEKGDFIMKKKTVSILLVAGMTLLGAVPAFASSGMMPQRFPDVSPDSWYYEACEYVGERGIFNGMDDGTFSPQMQMTQAMFLQALANNTRNYDAGLFSKDTPDAWYDDAMGWACCVNLIGGDEVASAKEAITREKAAELMYQYAAVTDRLSLAAEPDAENPDSAENKAESGDPAEDLKAYYADASRISGSAAGAVLWCAQNGIMRGDGEQFRPDGILTRAETAQLFMNAEQLLQDAKTCAIGHFDASEVEEMLFQNGNTGARYTCTDREAIEYIVGQLNSFRYDEISRRPLSDGWSLALEVSGKDGTKLWSTLPGTETMSAPYTLQTDGTAEGYVYSYVSATEDCLAELCGMMEGYLKEAAK